MAYRVRVLRPVDLTAFEGLMLDDKDEFNTGLDQTVVKSGPTWTEWEAKTEATRLTELTGETWVAGVAHPSLQFTGKWAVYRERFWNMLRS